MENEVKDGRKLKGTTCTIETENGSKLTISNLVRDTLTFIQGKQMTTIEVGDLVEAINGLNTGWRISATAVNGKDDIL